MFVSFDMDMQRSFEQEDDVVGFAFHAEQIGISGQFDRMEAGRIEAAVVAAYRTTDGTKRRIFPPVVLGDKIGSFHHFSRLFLSHITSCQ